MAPREYAKEAAVWFPFHANLGSSNLFRTSDPGALQTDMQVWSAMEHVVCRHDTFDRAPLTPYQTPKRSRKHPASTPYATHNLKSISNNTPTNSNKSMHKSTQKALWYLLHPHSPPFLPSPPATIHTLTPSHSSTPLHTLPSTRTTSLPLQRSRFLHSSHHAPE